MKLRNHPAFNYHGLPSWPPIWCYLSGPRIDRPAGEVGVLAKAEPGIGEPPNRCFLHIEYKGGRYIGCLYVAEPISCGQMVSFFLNHLGEEISAVGDLEISNPLQPTGPAPSIGLGSQAHHS